MPPSTRQSFVDGATVYENRFSTSSFDPKAVTRASYEPKKKKPKPDGPLVSVNRHPDAHQPLTYRSGNYAPMSRWTKKCVVWVRWVQVGLRALALVVALGLLVMTIILTGLQIHAQWALRVMSGIAAVHCVYSIYHHSRPAGRRPPSSSAAYQFFSALSDICIVVVYVFGIKTAGIQPGHGNDEISSLVGDKDLVPTFTLAVYYGLMASASLHAVSLGISVWLAVMFRRIAVMPPDMNPLEDNLTARARHKKSKSSVSTAHSDSSAKSLESHRLSGSTVPFSHTRAGSAFSGSSNRDSRQDLPSRHSYQSTAAPRPSPPPSYITSDVKRMSMPSPLSNRGSYVGVPLNDPSMEDDTPNNNSSTPTQHSRVGKFTETWSATDSLISRTQKRNRAIAAQERERERASKSYEMVAQPYSYAASDSDGDVPGSHNLAVSDSEDDLGQMEHHHPNPLGSNPAATPPRARTPYYPRASNVLSETSMNKRAVSGSMDIVDLEPAGASTRASRPRDSSIQPESAFYSKPYGQLKPATPPIMIGGNRQVSSGNDYDTGSTSVYERRNVSGKIAEEGLAGRGSERYSGYGGWKR